MSASYEEDPKAQRIISALTEECRANERGYKQWREAVEQFYDLLGGEPCDIQNVPDLALSAKIVLLIIAATNTKERYDRLREITKKAPKYMAHLSAGDDVPDDCWAPAGEPCTCGLDVLLAALDAENGAEKR